MGGATERSSATPALEHGLLLYLLRRLCFWVKKE